MINIKEAYRLLKKEMPSILLEPIAYENDKGYLFCEKDADVSPIYMSKKTGKTFTYFPPNHTEEENNSWVEVEMTKEFNE